ncbi:MAG: YbhB/YbcL family Raf kinase inhibitor-like protein [Candidatus Doudnabacteria bacterium]|nr:YbhB/YbcL family Raf kinase inhibitor-like protein [Candidatus Doudnabacteria bacterium]
MQITSPAFENSKSIPAKYTCDGDGVNPPLTFRDLPEGVKTLALIMDDPDAPAGTWTHWLVWNISPESRELAENSVPFGAIVGQGSNGQTVYGGPCPPSGMHRYFFKLYALDTKLSIPTYSLQADLEKAMSGHILGQAELVGVYGRNK